MGGRMRLCTLPHNGFAKGSENMTRITLSRQKKRKTKMSTWSTRGWWERGKEPLPLMAGLTKWGEKLGKSTCGEKERETWSTEDDDDDDDDDERDKEPLLTITSQNCENMTKIVLERRTKEKTHTNTHTHTNKQSINQTAKQDDERI